MGYILTKEERRQFKKRIKGQKHYDVIDYIMALVKEDHERSALHSYCLMIAQKEEDTLKKYKSKYLANSVKSATLAQFARAQWKIFDLKIDEVVRHHASWILEMEKRDNIADLERIYTEMMGSYMLLGCPNGVKRMIKQRMKEARKVRKDEKDRETGPDGPTEQ